MQRPSRPLQRTLRHAVYLSGISLHSGLPSCVSLSPAPANTGVVFVTAGGRIPADIQNVCEHGTKMLSTMLRAPATEIQHEREGGRAWVNTVEHLLAVLAAYRVDNIEVAVSSSEGDGDGGCLPMMDGSAAAFCDALDGNVEPVKGGVQRRVLKVLRDVEVASDCGRRIVKLRAGGADLNLQLDVKVDYGTAIAGGPQQMVWALPVNGDVSAAAFRRDIAGARTFCMERDLVGMRSLGLAKGGSLETAVVYGKGGLCLNEGGLRWRDEAVRHKILDAVGDLSLAKAGYALSGRFEGVRPGHDLHRRLLLELTSSEANYELIQ
jgi:UDP-3-O-[3-hydroxymyristoyl] N-acetylglucosamine deacetylase